MKINSIAQVLLLIIALFIQFQTDAKHVFARHRIIGRVLVTSSKIEGCGPKFTYPPLRKAKTDEPLQADIAMIDSNNLWTSRSAKSLDFYNSKFSFTAYNFKIKPDSSIGSTTYGKVYSNSLVGKDDYKVFGYCMEKDNKLFFSTNAATLDEGLIYDFSAKKNDTVIVSSPRSPLFDTKIKGVVDSVSTIFLGGINRKVVYFSPKFGKAKQYFTKWTILTQEQIKWVEGIGAIEDLLFSSITPGVITGYRDFGYPLVCFESNKNLIYQNKFYPSCDFKDWVLSKNYPMIDNNIWTSEGLGNHPSFRSSYKIKVSKDSIVDDITYGKFVYGETSVLVKEQQNKVYIIVNDGVKKLDKLIYDFGCSKDDTITVFSGAFDSYIKGHVDSTSVEEFNGVPRKVVYFTCTHWINKMPNEYTDNKWQRYRGKMQHKWVEGIGNILGDLFHQRIGEPMITGFNAGTPIICFENEGKLIYKREGYKTCEFINRPLSSVSKEELGINSFTLFPNPTNTILNIQSKEVMSKYIIYQSNGTKLLETLATESIDVSALPQGLYLLEAWDKEGRRALKKFEKR